MDPHADSYALLSPYSWVANNPLSIIDPNGQDVNSTSFGTTYTGADAQNLFRQLQSRQSSRSSGSGDPGQPTFYSFNGRTQARREQMAKAEKATEEPDVWSMLTNAGEGALSSLVSSWEGVKNEFTLEGTFDRVTMAVNPGIYLSKMATNVYQTGAQLAKDIPNWDGNDWSFAGGYVAGMIGQTWLTKKVYATGLNISVGGSTFSLLSKVSAPGMIGRRVFGLKLGKFQMAVDYHNWVMRSARDLTRGFGPITRPFWHYHFGKGNPGGKHMSIRTRQPIMSGSDLRNGWLGPY